MTVKLSSIRLAIGNSRDAQAVVDKKFMLDSISHGNSEISTIENIKLPMTRSRIDKEKVSPPINGKTKLRNAPLTGVITSATQQLPIESIVSTSVDNVIPVVSDRPIVGELSVPYVGIQENPIWNWIESENYYLPSPVDSTSLNGLILELKEDSGSLVVVAS